ncbi:helicase HerA-like C-terminal domain-containing protein [Undibacterium sp. SXout7W]|uniref:helicase HerA-like C-terminal domain-containing protein n=1 Tax=Undibacterium sp. SXout7W TaxID=3413049 RepID=UPI003BF1B929
MSKPLLIAKNSDLELFLLSDWANRHGCITGATGTGKTVTLQVMAQAFSEAGVPVFMADIKGDLSGLAKSGSPTPKIQQRINTLGLTEPVWNACPVTFWDVFGKQGHPVRATVSDLGPLLLGRMLNLNDTQEGVLQLAFKIADDHGLLLLDAKDLRAMLQYLGDNASEFQTEYGNISAASIGAIQRGLLAIAEQGGEQFFGEPMLNLDDMMQTDIHGHGYVNILAADQLLQSPRLYSTFLLWMLSELYEHLPEVGDLDQPKMVFFFDEAHLLFDEAPKALLQKIEQVVRLIRSKGVGIYFVTQNPLDIPDTVLGQLGNRVQHALRAYTPRDQKAVQAAAETFRPNPALDTAQVIGELAVGEALVSFLDDKGRPNIVQRAFIIPPASQIGPVDVAERQQMLASSIVAGVYEKTIDRESAYEKLKGRVVANTSGQTDSRANRNVNPAISVPDAVASPDSNAWGNASPVPASIPSIPSNTARQTTEPRTPEASDTVNSNGVTESLKNVFGNLLGGTGGIRRRDNVVETMVKSAVRTIGSQVGREIIRGVLGSIMKK